jgi:hypothetical protein
MKLNPFLLSLEHNTKMSYLVIELNIRDMQHRRLNIFIGSLLAGLFFIFNVGLPIVLFVCPMMADAQCACSCSKPTSDGPAYTYVHTSCCNTSVLADRNTIPFLGSQKYEPPHSEVIFQLAVRCQYASELPGDSGLMTVPDIGPPGPNIPRYLLSSSFLI